jgi:hypothetical protein
MMMQVEQPQFGPFPLAVPLGHQGAALIGIGPATVPEQQLQQPEIVRCIADRLRPRRRIGHDALRHIGQLADILHPGIAGMGRQRPGILMHQQRTAETQQGQQQPDQSAGPAMQGVDQPH